MPRKIAKAKHKAPTWPPQGTPEYAQWKRNISTGMVRAKRRRRDNGYLTLAEVAAQVCLPITSITRMANEGQFALIQVGKRRRYIRQAELDRWKIRTGETAA